MWGGFLSSAGWEIPTFSPRNGSSWSRRKRWRKVLVPFILKSWLLYPKLHLGVLSRPMWRLLFCSTLMKRHDFCLGEWRISINPMRRLSKFLGGFGGHLCKAVMQFLVAHFNATCVLVQQNANPWWFGLMGFNVGQGHRWCHLWSQKKRLHGLKRHSCKHHKLIRRF